MYNFGSNTLEMECTRRVAETNRLQNMSVVGLQAECTKWGLDVDSDKMGDPEYVLEVIFMILQMMSNSRACFADPAELTIDMFSNYVCKQFQEIVFLRDTRHLSAAESPQRRRVTSAPRQLFFPVQKSTRQHVAQSRGGEEVLCGFWYSCECSCGCVCVFSAERARER